MNIKILGTGCPNCLKLEENTKQALVELKMEAQVEKITEIQDIMSYGVMSTPALVLDGEVVLAGQVASAEKIKQLLADNESKTDCAKNIAGPGGCNCGGKC